MGLSRIARCVLGAIVISAAFAHASADAVTPLPAGWPGHLLIGMADAEHGAAALRASTPLEARYHYLSGGVNTGRGWTTWAEGDGSFASEFVADSQASGFLPVFSLYEIRPSNPGAADSAEDVGDLRNLRTRATMQAFFAELQTFFDRARAAGGPLVLHVEPDLWGYVERAARHDDAATVPAQVAATGIPELAGLPNTAAGLAQAIVHLRDLHAPNVILGYHVSVWGTGEDIARSDPTDAHVDALAGRAASFYDSLGASFDVLFAEFADRTAGYAAAVDHDRGAVWTAADFARHARFLGDLSDALQRRVVLWQIPLGNRVMRAEDNTPFHYQDNRVEWLLGPASRAHLEAYERAGVIGLLFGKAQPRDTCACDDAQDGVTDPPAIGANSEASLSADDDGGYFRRQVAAYYAAGPLVLPAAVTRPARGHQRRRPPALALTASIDRSAVRRGGRVLVRVRVTARNPTAALVAVQFYAPGGRRPVRQVPFRSVRLRAGLARDLRTTFAVPAGAAPGRWRIKVGVFDPDWKRLYLWSEDAAAFTVR